jgi:hypothetical protein
VCASTARTQAYHGDLTPLPHRCVARQRLCLRATTDYWINARDNPRQRRFTLAFDREAYSPEFFAEMKSRRIAILSYRKYPGEDWPVEAFAESSVRLASGEEVTMKLAERGTMLSNRQWVREVRKLSEGGHQTSILSTNDQAGYTLLAVSMFARWSQENFYKYMRQHYGCLALWTCPAWPRERWRVTSRRRGACAKPSRTGTANSSPTGLKPAWHRYSAISSAGPTMRAHCCARRTARRSIRFQIRRTRL